MSDDRDVEMSDVESGSEAGEEREEGASAGGEGDLTEQVSCWNASQAARILHCLVLGLLHI